MLFAVCWIIQTICFIILIYNMQKQIQNNTRAIMFLFTILEKITNPDNPSDILDKLIDRLDDDLEVKH